MVTHYSYISYFSLKCHQTGSMLQFITRSTSTFLWKSSFFANKVINSFLSKWNQAMQSKQGFFFIYRYIDRRLCVCLSGCDYRCCLMPPRLIQAINCSGASFIGVKVKKGPTHLSTGSHLLFRHELNIICIAFKKQTKKKTVPCPHLSTSLVDGAAVCSAVWIWKCWNWICSTCLQQFFS